MVNIENLSFHYKRKNNLFSGLNLSLKPGNIYGLLGKNGAGKTTLLKIIAGALSHQSGSCEIDSIASMARNPLALSEIYFVPEEFYTPPLTAGEFEKMYAPFYPRFSHDVFETNLKEFGLGLNEKLTSQSYGQKKKTLISFGLAANTKLLILDEPTNGLDIPSKASFRRLLAACSSEDRTFVVSTHQVRDLEALIDPIVILDQGKIVFQHSSDEISDKLNVRWSQENPAGDNILYSEAIPGGFSILEESNGLSGSKIDIEMLFNAVLTDSARIRQIFEGR